MITVVATGATAATEDTGAMEDTTIPANRMTGNMVLIGIAEIVQRMAVIVSLIVKLIRRLQISLN